MTPSRADQLVEAGLWLRLSGDLEGAKKLFEQALELNPEHARARELLDSPLATVFPTFGEPQKDPAPSPPKNSAPPGNGSIPPKSAAAGKATPAKSPPAAKEQNSKGSGGVEFTELEAFSFDENPESSAAPTMPEYGMIELDPGEAGGLEGDREPEQASPRRDGPPPLPRSPGVNLPPLEAVEVELDESRPAKPPPKKNAGVKTLLKGAQDLLELDDHTGAIELILKAQQLAPKDPGVRKMREKSEHVLQTMFESKLGSMNARPRVALKEDEIIWLNLDHRAGFVLAQIDGSVTFDDLFAVSGMSRLDTARILAQLIDEGVIKV